MRLISLLPEETGDSLGSVFHRAVEIITSAPDLATQGLNKGIALLGTIQAAAHQADQFAVYGLFPLCVALLILHENSRMITEAGSFRLSYVFGRIIIVVTLILGYNRVCSLITHVAGAGGSWMSTDQLL